jgi:hypothetical protein
MKSLNRDSVFHLVQSENVAVCDVDFTLIEECKPSPSAQEMTDPRTGQLVYFNPYTEHIDLVKQMHGRGRYIIVWSAAGYAWANAVVDALKLKPFVHLIMTKPQVAVDDKPVEEWLPRVYLPKKG